VLECQAGGQLGIAVVNGMEQVDMLGDVPGRLP
jgi:hypothetical protein